MAMPAAGGEPPRAQKLRIMFKGTKLVEVTRPMQDPSTGEHHTASRFQCKSAMAACLLQHWTLPCVSFERNVRSKHCRALCGGVVGLLQRCSYPHILAQTTLLGHPAGMQAPGAKRAAHRRMLSSPCSFAGVEADQSASGLKPLSQGAGNSGGEREQSQLPSDLIDFLSRELEDCLSPLGESPISIPA